jgi:hypothetical protein
MDITYFTTNGHTWGKGFFNQNGHSFYVLQGFEEQFKAKVAQCLAPNVPYVVEFSGSLPG